MAEDTPCLPVVGVSAAETRVCDSDEDLVAYRGGESGGIADSLAIFPAEDREGVFCLRVIWESLVCDSGHDVIFSKNDWMNILGSCLWRENWSGQNYLGCTPGDIFIIQ